MNDDSPPILGDLIADNNGGFQNLRTGETLNLMDLLRWYSLLDVLTIPSVPEPYDIDDRQ